MKIYKGSTLVGALLAVFILSTTLVAILNLQVSIIQADFFRKYDNTANLLVSEGLELVRAVYANNSEDISSAPWNEGIQDGRYVVDYSTMNVMNGTQLLSTQSIGNACDATTSPATISSSCALMSSGTGYRANPAGTTIYRYVDISGSSSSSSEIQVKSVVMVRNPRLNTTRVYSADMTLFNVNNK